MISIIFILVLLGTCIYQYIKLVESDDALIEYVDKYDDCVYDLESYSRVLDYISKNDEFLNSLDDDLKRRVVDDLKRRVVDDTKNSQ